MPKLKHIIVSPGRRLTYFYHRLALAVSSTEVYIRFCELLLSVHSVYNQFGLPFLLLPQLGGVGLNYLPLQTVPHRANFTNNMHYSCSCFLTVLLLCHTSVLSFLMPHKDPFIPPAAPSFLSRTTFLSAGGWGKKAKDYSEAGETERSKL